jgi:hypothetical protein
MSSVRTTALILGAGAIVLASVSSWSPVLAQAPATQRSASSDAAVDALVAEVRALRADLAQATQRSMRAQLLLGRLQMQEQRLAYLDRQRSETAARALEASRATAGMVAQVEQFDGGGCLASPTPQQRRDCEQMAAQFKRQLGTQQAFEQHLLYHENDLTNALAQEQARWSDVNGRLDDLERTLNAR